MSERASVKSPLEDHDEVVVVDEDRALVVNVCHVCGVI